MWAIFVNTIVLDTNFLATIYFRLVLSVANKTLLDNHCVKVTNL